MYKNQEPHGPVMVRRRKTQSIRRRVRFFAGGQRNAVKAEPAEVEQLGEVPVAASVRKIAPWGAVSEFHSFIRHQRRQSHRYCIRYHQRVRRQRCLGAVLVGAGRACRNMIGGGNAERTYKS